MLSKLPPHPDPVDGHPPASIATLTVRNHVESGRQYSPIAMVDHREAEYGDEEGEPDFQGDSYRLVHHDGGLRGGEGKRVVKFSKG